MIDTILFYTHHGLTLLLGIVLSAAFCGVRFTKKNICIVSAIFLFCAILLLAVFLMLGEELVWKLYPLIVHLPLGAFLCLAFRKRIVTVSASVALSYLCCQPSNWFGLLAEVLVDFPTVVWCVRIAVALCTSALFFFYFAEYASELFNKDTRGVLIFGCIPLIYYVFEYIACIYTDLWVEYSHLASEFLALFLCITFIVFCMVYYREYEKKRQVQRKNQIIEITVQQREKEIEAIRKSNLETSLLRHDMRLLLSNLAVSIEQNDKKTALSLISGYVSEIESASMRRYCQNDTVNYILANFDSKCRKAGIDFRIDLDIEDLSVDEVMFSSILSNALDNALNAQLDMPRKERQIKLLLKNSNGKLLLSVKNPFHGTISLDPATQLPTSTKKDHGYGTQSILYLTQKLGGKCQFSTQQNLFILRVIL